MEIFWDIALHTVEILTLLFGVLGMAFSLLLLASPGLTKSVGTFLNRSFSVSPTASILDKDISTEAFVYSHHVFLGICLVTGSAFAFFFFLFNIDIAKFANIFLGSQKYFKTLEIIFYFFAWIVRIGSFCGLIIGLFLLFAPQKLKAFEKKVNTWFETQSFFNKLDRSGPELDALFFRYPFFFGMAGAVISFLVITLSIVNLLS